MRIRLKINFFSLQIAQKIYYKIEAKHKQDNENLQEFFTVYGDDLKSDENLPKTSELSDDIDKLMQTC